MENCRSNAYEAVIRVQENLAYEDAFGEERFDAMFKLLLNGKRKRSS